MITLPENEVHLWYVKVDEFPRDVASFSNLLSSEESAKASTFKFTKDRTMYSMARGLLRILSGHYLNQIPENIKFNYGAFGKPDYDFRTPLKFNVSHSGKMIALAFVKNFDIGVDIEMIKDNFDVIDIAQHFFSSDEIQTLEALPEKEKVHGFYRCWTRKESFIKAKGSGLSFPLTSFSVSLDVDTAELLRTDWDATEKEEWQMFTLALANDYLAAVSVLGDVNCLHHFDLDTILPVGFD